MDRCEWVTPLEWDPGIIRTAQIAKRRQGNPGSKAKKLQILDIPAAFDIETSHTPGREDAHLYHWQMQIGLDTPTIHGRTWDDFRQMLDRLRIAIPDGNQLIIYVHFLSFEWQHLRTVYPFRNEEIFCTGPRSILYARMFDNKIEFRCSNLLTNLSLSEWTHKMGVAHPKLDSDAYDHDQIRFPWTQLSEEELLYCRNDVLGLCEALVEQMSREGDTLATIPYTSTGYVRRDVKAAMKNWSRLTIRKIQPTPECYRLLREMFRGGDTHANRHWAGELIANAGHIDRSSSYPDVLVNCRFPMTPWRRWIRLSVSELYRLKRLDMALAMRVRFKGLRLRSVSIGDPPLSFSKCRAVLNYWLDNGRVLCADSLITCINDIDLMVYEDAYTWDEIEILEGWYSQYDYLPDPLRQLIIYYYKQKTELKGVTGQIDGVDAEILYTKSKNRINAIYGDMVRDVAKPDVVFNGTGFEAGEDDLENKLEKHSRKAYNAYQWGVWCTSWARFRLWEMIRKAGRNYVYGDTDSLVHVGEIDVSEYNRQRIKDSTASGAYAVDSKGKTHYMGVFEAEETHKEFITWGSKRYAYRNQDGSITTTVAGVSKRLGPAELALHGGLSAFKPGMIWTMAAGTEHKYNDLTREVITIDGHRLELGPNIYITPSTYNLKLDSRKHGYAELIEDPDCWTEILDDARSFDGFESEFN